MKTKLPWYDRIGPVRFYVLAIVAGVAFWTLVDVFEAVVRNP